MIYRNVGIYLISFMRKQLLTLTFICSCFTISAQAHIDVFHYRYRIDLNDKNDTLKGQAEIVGVTTDETSTVELDLSGLNKDKGMTVSLITSGIAGSGVMDFSHHKDKLVITLSHRSKKGDTVRLAISYQGIPDDGLIISKNKYGDRTFFADNWPDRAHHWIPCVDRPDDKATFEFFVTAPSHYSVISNGTKIKEELLDDGRKLTHWKENTPLPSKVMVIGVARFAVRTYKDSPPAIPVSAWVYQQDSLPGFRNYAIAPSILKFLTNYIGPYPYEKLANVQSKTIFGGMENASAIFYEELSASSDDNIESLMAHEIAHQWFGDMASEKNFPHLWLSEGFATYLTHIYLEAKYGTDSLDKRMKDDRDEIVAFAKQSNQAVVDSVSPLMKLLNTNSYQKGGWILHMLRRQLGDTVFHKIIRSYYSAYAGKNADTRDFEKICEAESGKDLHVFFDQWLYSPGLPRLDVQWKYDEPNKRVLLTIHQAQHKLFVFPLEIEIWAGGTGTTKEQIQSVTTQDQQVSFPVAAKPLQVILDPHTSLLFEGSARMIK
jgi:aminopeptidase N